MQGHVVTIAISGNNLFFIYEEEGDPLDLRAICAVDLTTQLITLYLSSFSSGFQFKSYGSLAAASDGLFFAAYVDDTGGTGVFRVDETVYFDASGNQEILSVTSKAAIVLRRHDLM
jgi:hypothetical protein